MRIVTVSIFLLCLTHLLSAQTQPSKELPFLDDFTYFYHSSKPDKSLWTDSAVRINNTNATSMPSIGICSFDALNAKGELYNHGSGVIYADSLTSVPINLLTDGADKAILSFFYMAGGLADPPEPSDSLALFFKKQDNNWTRVWASEGKTMTDFEQVLLPIPEEFLYNGFQFRFINKISLTKDAFNEGIIGNADLWHLDYIYLDKNRTTDKTYHTDVTVAAPLNSLISGYTSIPFKQLEFAEKTKLLPQLTIQYRNLDNKSRQVGRTFKIQDRTTKKTITLNGGSENIEPNQLITYKQDLLSPFITTAVDSATFDIFAYLTTDDYDRKANDTIRFVQHFSDYFSRDDGSPESGYGFKGINAQDCAIACRYETFMPDILRKIKIYFNSTLNNSTKNYRFKIAVWKDANGTPGDLLYLSNDEYSPQCFDDFSTYKLSKGIYLTRFYWIGLIQTTNGFLNIGFDRNYDDHQNLFYNNSSWKMDSNKGTLMLRPIFSSPEPIPTHTKPNYSIPSQALLVYPNPVTDIITISIPDNILPSTIELYNLSGQRLLHSSYTPTINLSFLPTGHYLILIRTKDNKTLRTKIQKL